MNNLLNNSFSTSVPLASVISSILFMIYGNIGLHILAAICLIIPGLVFLFISLYLFIQFERLITIEQIQKTVAAYYNVRVSDLLSAKRDRKITLPRHIAMSIAKQLTSHSLPTIGDAFGGRDHTTVLHACKKVKALKLSSATVDQDCQNILHTLNN